MLYYISFCAYDLIFQLGDAFFICVAYCRCGGFIFSYYTIKQSSIFQENEKRSKFISYSFKISSDSDAKNFISQVKSKHYNAKHYVYAYSLFDDKISKSSDDGEPPGTAGIPILNAILSENVTNVLIVIVRYFGGILLGASGLRKMYSSGAINVLKMSEKSKVVLCNQFNVRLGYNQYNTFKNLVELNNGKVMDTSFTNDVSVLVCIPKEDSKRALNSFKKLFLGDRDITVLNEIKISI